MLDTDGIINGLDQSFPIDSSKTIVLKNVESIITVAISGRDPSFVINELMKLLSVNKISGLATAKLLYLAKQQWSNIDDTVFEEKVQAEIGLTPVTISRYIKVWDMFANGAVPEQLVDNLTDRPMKDLVAISATVSQGYEINDEEWDNLAYAPDNSTVLAELRDIKGVEPRKSSMIIRLKKNGDLYAYSNNRQVFVGYLDINSVSDEGDLAEKAIERIIGSAGILKE